MTTPPPPSPADDARDARVAAWLAVDPLDEITRARLVRDAVAGADGATPVGADRRRRGPLLAVAAVVVALVAVTLAVLATRDPGSSTTAADTPRTETGPAAAPAPESSRRSDEPVAAAPGQAVAPAGDSAGTALVLADLGDLGDVSTPDRLGAAVAARLSVSGGTTTTTVTGCASDAGRAFGTPVAAGTGEIGGRPATVVVATQAAGTTAAVAVRGRSCARGVSVVLP